MQAKPLKSSTSGCAVGENKFFNRPGIIKKIRRKLKNKENLLVSAPRRIGKTSLLKHIVATPEEGQIIKYLIVQSIASVDEFNRKLHRQLIQDKAIFRSSVVKKTTAAIKSKVSQVKEIGAQGLKFDGPDQLDYYEELDALFEELRYHDSQIIVFLDEFPDAVLNIADTSKSEAIRLLQQQRELCEKYKNGSIQFAYTGSTGLANVVKGLGKIYLINHLTEITVPPLSDEEASNLMRCLVLGKQHFEDAKNLVVPDSVIDYTVSRLNWYLPHFVQLMMDALYDAFEEDAAIIIDKEAIERLLSQVVRRKSNYSNYFVHWETRLKYLPPDQRLVAKETLNIAALESTISYEEYVNIEVKHKVKGDPRVIDLLQHDGYLIKNEDNQFGFNSLLLQQWWAHNVAK